MDKLYVVNKLYFRKANIWITAYLIKGSKFNPIQDGPFWTCSRKKTTPSPKCTIMKIGTVIPYINQVTQPLTSAFL